MVRGETGTLPIFLNLFFPFTLPQSWNIQDFSPKKNTRKKLLHFCFTAVLLLQSRARTKAAAGLHYTLQTTGETDVFSTNWTRDRK